MGLRRWWQKRAGGSSDARLTDWRRDWVAATDRPDEPAVAVLAARLEALGLAEDDVEVEREMLEALRSLAQLASMVGAGGLPVLQTGHRVVASDICHFSAPVSMPDDPSQPTGRLLLTSARALFVGGARATSVAWHSVAEVVQSDRDVVLVRKGTDTLHRFRCNNYGDALCAAYLARRLAAPRTPRRAEPGSPGRDTTPDLE